MDRPRYRTPDGRELYIGEVNTHHVQYPRAEYKSPLERRFRQLGGLVLPTWVPPHNELHALTEPPIKPNPDLMRDIIQVSAESEYTSPYDKFREITDYLFEIIQSERNETNVQDAARLLGNYVHQSVYIELGQVERIQEVA